MAGTNVNQAQRYVWVNNVGWIDLQHVISSALGPFNRLYATYNTAGLAMELRQSIDPRSSVRESAFKPEDLRSNELGNIAYRLSEITKQSLGEAVRTLIEQMDPQSASSGQKSPASSSSSAGTANEGRTSSPRCRAESGSPRRRSRSERTVVRPFSLKCARRMQRSEQWTPRMLPSRPSPASRRGCSPR